MTSHPAGHSVSVRLRPGLRVIYGYDFAVFAAHSCAAAIRSELRAIRTHYMQIASGENTILENFKNSCPE